MCLCVCGIAALSADGDSSCDEWYRMMKDRTPDRMTRHEKVKQAEMLERASTPLPEGTDFSAQEMEMAQKVVQERDVRL